MTSTSPKPKWRSEQGQELADRLEQISVQLYESAAEYASKRGIIIADTKFEFGTVDGEIILIDEVLTPRFVPLLAAGRI